MYGKQALLLWNTCVWNLSMSWSKRAYASTCRRDGNPFSSGACQYFVTRNKRTWQNFVRAGQNIVQLEHVSFWHKITSLDKKLSILGLLNVMLLSPSTKLRSSGVNKHTMNYERQDISSTSGIFGRSSKIHFHPITSDADKTFLFEFSSKNYGDLYLQISVESDNMLFSRYWHRCTTSTITTINIVQMILACDWLILTCLWIN